MKKLIHDSYREAVALSTVPQGLKDSLRTNERVPGFLSRLEAEVKKLPAGIKSSTVKMLVYDMTTLFLQLVHKRAEERMLSDAARTAIKQNADKLKRFKDAADTGIITEEVLEDG